MRSVRVVIAPFSVPFRPNVLIAVCAVHVFDLPHRLFESELSVRAELVAVRRLSGTGEVDPAQVKLSHTLYLTLHTHIHTHSLSLVLVAVMKSITQDQDFSCPFSYSPSISQLPFCSVTLSFGPCVPQLPFCSVTLSLGLKLSRSLPLCLSAARSFLLPSRACTVFSLVCRPLSNTRFVSLSLGVRQVDEFIRNVRGKLYSTSIAEMQAAMGARAGMHASHLLLQSLADCSAHCFIHSLLHSPGLYCHMLAD